MNGRFDLEGVVAYILNKATPDELKIIITVYEKRLKKSNAKGHLDEHLLAGKNRLREVVDYILKIMPPEELDVVKAALDRKINRESTFYDTENAKGEESDIVRNLGGRMNGLYDSIHRTVRMLIADIILQHEPEIPDRHLEELLNEWAPSGGVRKPHTDIPGDILLTMIEHFVSFGKGNMPEELIREFPEGWTEKYWNAFPMAIKQIIGSFIYNKIDADIFWGRVKQLIDL